MQQDSSKPAGEPQINLIFLRSITQTGSVLYIHMLILVYTQWHVYVTQPALSYDGLKLLGDLCKKQKEPMIYQWEAEVLLKPNTLKMSVRKEKHAFAVAA